VTPKTVEAHYGRRIRSSLGYELIGYYVCHQDYPNLLLDQKNTGLEKAFKVLLHVFFTDMERPSCSSSSSMERSSASITNIKLTFKDDARMNVENWLSGSGTFVQNSSKGTHD